MSLPQDKVEWELPHLREALLFPKGQGRPMISATAEKAEDFWSVKFYPFTEPNVPPVFAVVGEMRILICRPPLTPKDGKAGKLDVLLFMLDEEDGADNFACAWTKDIETSTPLLCVAGSTGKIKILDILKGTFIRSLIGHGGPINDLAICPTNPNIIASGSDDHTIRIWNLDPAHAKQPCVALLEGYGHTDNVQTISFHANGRYLLSGGVDRRINLWTLPVFSKENTGKERPLRIFYPHFSTDEIHTRIVDCILWHGDLIFSKADSEESIVMWSIDNFDSSLPPPDPIKAPAIPVPFRNTRSFFSPTSGTAMGYTTHLVLSIKSELSIFFTRFAIFHGSPTKNPVLAYCNAVGKVYFWDLARFRGYNDFIDTFPDISNNNNNANDNESQSSTPSTPSENFLLKAQIQAHPFLKAFQPRARRPPGRPPRIRDSESTASGSVAGDGLDESKGKIDWTHSRELWDAKYSLREPKPNKELLPHETLTVSVNRNVLLGRQLAWSRDGRWCVAVGSWGCLALMERWGGRE